MYMYRYINHTGICIHVQQQPDTDSSDSKGLVSNPYEPKRDKKKYAHVIKDNILDTISRISSSLIKTFIRLE